jgi:L-gulonolactone oxidase
VEHPASEEELSRIVERAAQAGHRVKVVGTGHSFTPIALTDGSLVQLDRYRRVVAVDRERCGITVQAGITLSALNKELAALGMALPNLGDVEYQTVAGAVSTGTHGTGARYQGIASQITALRLITGDGAVVDCSPEQEPDVFHAARVGLGALGVLSTVTLQCVPAFNLHAVEFPMRWDDVFEQLHQLVDENDHFEFYYVPHTNWCLTKRNNRTQDPPSPRSRWKEFYDDMLLQNVAFGLICRLGRVRPSLIPRLATAVPGSGRVDYVDRSDRVFTSPRLVRFYEMEYAIARDACQEALTRVRRLIDETGLLVSFPIEVRFLAADDIPLSMAHGRESCFIAVHMYQGTEYHRYFEGVEGIMRDYGGRPHWGKLHLQTAEALSQAYTEWDRFQSVRERLDPRRVFSNAYLERVLGR